MKAIIEILLEKASDERSKARLLTNTLKETEAWLNALPFAACGLRMDDDTICVAVGLQIGAPLCHPHQCPLRTHGLSCQWSEGHFSRHAAINDIIYRSLHTANVPSHLEPSGLYNLMGDDLMEFLLFLGSAVDTCTSYGMLLLQILTLHPIFVLQPGERVRWLCGLNN